jgi:hypothetical protein
MLQLAKHFHAKFQLSSFYPDGLRLIFDHFSSKFQNSEKNLNRALVKYIFNRNFGHLEFDKKKQK